jgi:beta-barrel assembly-enhancing protease
MATAAWLYDGRSAVKRSAHVSPADGGLRLTSASGAEAFVAAEQLTRVESRGHEEIYGHKEIAGWRLGIPKPLPSELEPLLPRRHVYGRWIDRVGLVPAVLVGALVSAGLIFLGTQIPALLAPHVPVSWERRFGDVLVGNMDERTCNRPESQAALDKLVAQLTPRHRELKVRVADLGIVNAAALPGGNIVIFKELLLEAESPEEAAGVLAHEIAHIENRDVTRAMIRHYGLGLLLTGLGGTTGGNIDTLLTASYSREAEAQADRDAIAALQRANISPAPTARFFERMDRRERTYRQLDEALNYLSTHPLSQERRRLFEEAAQKGRAYRAPLSEAEWRMLQDICWQGPVEAKRVE